MKLKRLKVSVFLSVLLAGFLSMSNFAFAGWEWQNPLPQGNRLNDVWGNSANNVFAVGCCGSILHYEGSNWSLMDTGTTHYLYGVWGSSDSDVFAVGRQALFLVKVEPYYILTATAGVKW